MIKFYVYVMTYDTGFAPSVCKGTLTLATCKTFLRYKIGKEFNTDNNTSETYIMGICGKQLQARNSSRIDSNKLYSPVYIARVDSVAKTDIYHHSEGRPDQKYKYKNGLWYIKKNNPHHLNYVGEFENANQDRDLYYLPRLTKKWYEWKELNYILISNNYVYFGENLPNNSEIIDIIKDYCLNRANKCRNDLSPFEMNIDDEIKFKKWFNNQKEYNKTYKTIDNYFEEVISKGECNKR